MNTLKDNLNELMQEHVSKDVHGKFRISDDGKDWVFRSEADRDTYVAGRKSLFEQQFEMFI